MPFGGNFDHYYEAIYRPAAENVGLEVKRGDSLFGSGPIIHDIRGMTKAAHAILADLTSKNPNVFYELVWRTR
jgi:hypothetical protein